MDDKELFDLIQDAYHKENKEYIQGQIKIAAEYLTEEQKEELRNKSYII